ncbi:MAG: hypothetical protein ACAH83_02690 [Alphaproteobacteria bacterium]
MGGDTKAKKQLKLVRRFNDICGSDDTEKQFGYQKIDDTTVLERKELPVFAYGSTEYHVGAVMISVYDFKSCEVMTYVQQVYFADSDDNYERPQVFLRSFSDIEGKQGIIDAHDALTQLRGSPPPLEEISGLEPKLVSRLDKAMFPGKAR